MFEKKSLHTNSKKIMFETKKKVLRENIFSQNVKKYKFNYFWEKESLSKYFFLTLKCIYIFCYQCENIFSWKNVFLSKCFSSLNQNQSHCSRCNFLLPCQVFALAVKIISWAGPHSYWSVGWESSRESNWIITHFVSWAELHITNQLNIL